ncbi:MAG: hypothetical protein LBJ00_08565 [Planctomycetaceae bacterium]|nr:hypothetical protein [Planctomycetaceae bacterium]
MKRLFNGKVCHPYRLRYIKIGLDAKLKFSDNPQTEAICVIKIRHCPEIVLSSKIK